MALTGKDIEEVRISLGLNQTDGDGAIITFDYSGSVLTYKGYFNR